MSLPAPPCPQAVSTGWTGWTGCRRHVGWRRRLPQAFAGIAFVATLAACGGGSSASGARDATPGADLAPPSAEFLVPYLYDWYYWAERLPPEPPPGTYPDAEAALAALKVPEDRYSYIEPAASYNAFFDEGRTLGFGITYQIEGDALALRQVQPQSPAHAAGMRRGDRIVAIDGTPVAALVRDGALDDAFGPSEAGVTRDFVLRRGAEELHVAATRDWYDLSYVMASAVHDLGDRRVGYISFHSFGRPAPAAWRATLDGLLEAGARDLVVDLRENGGGLVAIAAQVGSALGLEDLAGRTMSRLEFNRAHPSSDRTFAFESDPLAGRFDRLVWLTSGRTCSASEMLMTGLAAWRPAIRVGTTTCGKPVGFTPPTHEGWVFSVVSFASRNALGDGDYFDGLAPDCPLADPVSGQFGERDEPLLAAALAWLADGRCPSGPAGKQIRAATGPDPSLRGLARLTGMR